jgi:excisionase family DNA binding protein
MTAALARESLLTTPQAQHQAHEISDGLDRETAQEQPVEVAGVELGDDIRALLHRIITIIGEGGTVTVGSMPEVITTTVAAELLGISRTTLMKHVRNGDLPSFRVGSHTKLRRDEVLAFRKSRLREQRDALDKLLAQEDEFDIQ